MVDGDINPSTSTNVVIPAASTHSIYPATSARVNQQGEQAAERRLGAAPPAL